MKVHVVTEPNWICRQLAEHLSGLPGFQVRVTQDRPRDANLTYYFPYLFREFYQPAGRSIGYFTHYVPGKHQDRYDRLARQCNHCIVVSSQHQEYLSALVGPRRVSRVHMPLPGLQPPKLRVGWFHRSPAGYDNRKRLDLLNVVRGLSWVDLIVSDGVMTPQELGLQMDRCDCFLTTSDYEAGPVSLLEALARGKYAVIPSGVGLADEFPAGPVIRFERGNASSLVSSLELIYQPIVRRYELVAENTINRWRADHAEIFHRVLR